MDIGGFDFRGLMFAKNCLYIKKKGKKPARTMEISTLTLI